MLGDAVLELAHVAPGEHFVELGLAEEDQLEELVAAGLQIGKQPDLLQRGLGHGVRFVDQGDHAAAFGVAFDERVLDRAEQRTGALAVQRQPQFGGQRA